MIQHIIWVMHILLSVLKTFGCCITIFVHFLKSNKDRVGLNARLDPETRFSYVNRRIRILCATGTTTCSLCLDVTLAGLLKLLKKFVGALRGRYFNQLKLHYLINSVKIVVTTLTFMKLVRSLINCEYMLRTWADELECPASPILPVRFLKLHAHYLTISS